MARRALLWVFLCAAQTAWAAEARRPNVIVIFTDDHGWADLGRQDVRKDIRTPHLDLLAEGGVRATNGYVTAPQCVPSRAGLLTGRYQNRFGLESNGEKLDGFDAQQTIAQRLKKAGYATGMTGKWHLGPPPQITRHGFDDVYCTQGGPRNTWANFDLEGRTVPGQVVKNDLYHLDANSAAACAFIRRHRDKPFFFYLAYRAPHTPLDAPPKYTSRFPGPMPERRRQALAMISAVDDGVGQVMKTLRECGLEDKTLIFFLGDNGAPLKIHKTDSPLHGDPGGWDGSLNDPMNGEKGMLSEGGIRVPWLVYWKGRIPGGQTYSHPVVSLDIAASAAALAGLTERADLDGVDLLPYLTGQKSDPPHERLFWRWIAQSAVREGQWKLLVGGKRQYLFDIQSDPQEKHNLLERHPQVAQRLRARLETWAGELQPPGLATKSMAPVWEAYYDFYLEGKAAPAAAGAAPAPGPLQGWIARNSSAEVKDGALHVCQAEGSPQRPFLARANLQVTGPARAEAAILCSAGGQAGFAWRLEGQKDFPPAQVVSVEVPGSPQWQSLSAELPARGRIIHLRVLLPRGECKLRRVALASTKDQSAERWSFSKP